MTPFGHTATGLKKGKAVIRTRKNILPPGSLSGGLLALRLVAFFAAGCGAAQQPQPLLPPQATNSQAQAEINRTLISRALLTPVSSADYRLGPDDLVEITLYNVVEEVGVTPRKAEVRVSQQGVISLPL